MQLALDTLLISWVNKIMHTVHGFKWCGRFGWHFSVRLFCSCLAASDFAMYLLCDAPSCVSDSVISGKRRRAIKMRTWLSARMSNQQGDLYSGKKFRVNLNITKSLKQVSYIFDKAASSNVSKCIVVLRASWVSTIAIELSKELPCNVLSLVRFTWFMTL